MVNKLVYETEVNMKFYVCTKDNKTVEKLIKKVSKVLNKENVGVDITINTLCSSYDFSESTKTKLKAYADQSSEDDFEDEMEERELED